jgi:hypothetical protein
MFIIRDNCRFTNLRDSLGSGYGLSETQHTPTDRTKNPLRVPDVMKSYVFNADLEISMS